MIEFNPVRTARLCVQLQELTLGSGAQVCQVPATQHERTITTVLKYAIASASTPLPVSVADPLAMTVQERNLLLARYLMPVTADGPDFAIGSGHLSDYLNESLEWGQEKTILTGSDGKRRAVYQLLGYHAQALETMCSTRGDWMLGAAACTVFDADTTPPDWAAMTDADLQNWITARTTAFDEMFESEFEAIFSAWVAGRDILGHYLRMEFNNQGIVFLPWGESKGGAGPVPARFLPRSALSSITLALYQ